MRFPRAARLVATTALAILIGGGLATPVLAEDDSIEAILAVLEDKGLIDEAEHTKILAKHKADVNTASSMPDVAAQALSGWDFSGDIRLRYEQFNYSHDDTGFDQSNRQRFRYRGRFKAQKQIQDWLKIGFRFVAGEENPRGTNQTLGDGPDFDTDDFRFDQAWMKFTHELDTNTKLALTGGKMGNPFYWKAGPDYMIWDHDITPEGFNLNVEQPLGEDLSLFANTAYFIVDENSSSSDPKLIALQGGAISDIADGVEMGVRLSGYLWRTLGSGFDPTAPADFTDSDLFYGRALDSGNLFNAFDGDKAEVGEVSLYFAMDVAENWPLKVWGTLAQNFSAESGIDPVAVSGGSAVTRADKEDTAWMAGIEVGDKKKFAKLGFLYGEIEANSLVAQFTDSDFVDGFTNRKGFSAYATRQIAPGVDLRFEVFKSKTIEDDGAFDGCDRSTAGACGPFWRSVQNADRWRARTDIQVEFD